LINNNFNKEYYNLKFLIIKRNIMDISQEEKQILLKTARDTIKSLFNPNMELKELNIDEHPVFASKSGAFVTLTQNKNLRGCIGYIISDRPLYQTVKDAAIQAATSDPRFPSLNVNEIDKIELEISILSEPFPLNNYDEIIVGKHGLILDEGNYRGLLLPQVPIEHNLNKEEYLGALCQKAGLYADYWKEKQLKLKAFTATVFSEENFSTEV